MKTTIGIIALCFFGLFAAAQQQYEVVVDTIYRQGKNGKLTMELKERKKTVRQKTKVLTNVGQKVIYDTIYIEDETGNITMEVVKRKASNKEQKLPQPSKAKNVDTIFVEDPATGTLHMQIIERK